MRLHGLRVERKALMAARPFVPEAGIYLYEVFIPSSMDVLFPQTWNVVTGDSPLSHVRD